MAKKTKKKTSQEKRPKAEPAPSNRCMIRPDSIKGSDDAGKFYSNYDELCAAQLIHKDRWYEANKQFWIAGGYGGDTDDEVMVGDLLGAEDGVEGLAFLDKMMAENGTGEQIERAVDAGAGVGRVTKSILLKRYKSVRLVEADPHFSTQSRVYLGRKRSARCTFTCARLEDLSDNVVAGWDGPVDLIWLQWTLQYLTDVDAIKTLQTLARGLVLRTGMLVVKENRPYGQARSDRFQIDTPACSGRYDITRTDAQHRLMFHRAGLKVNMSEEGIETNTYAVSAY